jgi:glycosyltransferase involved in cell wall biosynthesis
MRFSIITPSFRNSDWLKLCIASVADQGVESEHIVQDACSDDGTQEWLPHDPRVTAFIEKDRGMYDAVNRGFRRAKGEILAYINCDEQYLPGTLPAVWEFFQSHPKVEVAFAHSIVIGPDGDYRCERRACLPGRWHSWVSGSLAILTAATFYRRSLITDRGLWFDADHRDVSDALWVLKLIENRVSMAVLDRFTSAFTDTGDNMNLRPNAVREKAELFGRAPVWLRRSRPLLVAHFRLRRLLAGHYRRRAPYDYAIYTKASPKARTTFHAAQPTFRWVR